MLSLNELFASYEAIEELFSSFDRADVLGYLNRGDRLIQTLREKAARKPRFCKDDFLDGFSMSKILGAKNSCELFRYLGLQTKRYLRDRLTREAADDDDTGPALRFLEGFPGVTEITDAVDPRVPGIRCKGDVSRLIRFRFSKKREPVYGVLPASIEITPACNLSYGVRGHRRWYGRRYCDLALSFAPLFLAQRLRQMVQDEVGNLTEEQRRDNTVWRLLEKESRDAIEVYSDLGVVFYDRFMEKEPEYLCRWAEANGVSLLPSPPGNVKRLSLYSTPRVLCAAWLLYGTDAELSYVEMSYRPHNEWISSLMLDRELICSVFSEYVSKYTYRKREDEFLRTMEKAHARSFENLRDIPRKYVEAMAASRFNAFFGYVEYDPDVLLSGNEAAFNVIDPATGRVISTETIVSEFDALKSVLSLRPLPDVALRFRKLFHHHASGLFYPDLNCMCVDIRVPGSFFHELCHAYDHVGGDVSEGYAFRQCRERYTALVRDAVAQSNGLKARMGSGTKYGLDYYTRPTEIFARCGEIYLSRLCGVSCCLVAPRQQDSFAYPDDEVLNGLIREYFDGFFGVSADTICRSLQRREVSV